MVFASLSLGCGNDETSSKDPNAIDYLALGDSYTIGESVSATQTFPALIEEKYTQSIPWNSTSIIAQPGWTTNDLIQSINQADIGADFDLVTLCIGVNNQFKNQSIATYETEFQSLLTTAIEFVAGDQSKVIVLSIPDYAYTPFGQQYANPQNISDEIDAFNAVNKSLTEAAGVTYVDVTAISREGLDKPEYVANDDLHPSRFMYAVWVNEMKEELEAILID